MPDIKLHPGEPLRPEDLEDPEHPLDESPDEGPDEATVLDRRDLGGGLDQTGLDSFRLDRLVRDPLEGEGPEALVD